MIGGVHTIFYSPDAQAVRAFFRDVLRFPAVDAGHGWLLFSAPAGEWAVHPAEEAGRTEVYLMCSDLSRTMETLRERGVEFTEPVTEQRWGRLTRVKLPDGQSLGLYEPRHPTAIRMKPARTPNQKAKPRKRGGKKPGR